MAHPIDPFVSESHIFHRTLLHRPERLISAKGITLITESGRQIIDACAGPSVSVLGHHQPSVTSAISTQLNQLPYVYSGSLFTSSPTEQLATEILGHKPGNLTKAIFVNSGSEATDAALKLATQYWHELHQPQKSIYIARKQSYHGNTIGALCVSGHDSRRAFYQEWMSKNVRFVSPCYAFRCQTEKDSEEEYVQRLKKELEDEILKVGPENVAGFIAETVSGTTLGCVPAVPGYFRMVRELCDKYDVLLILDEIMCGMGKTGTMHAWEQEDIRGPDIQTIGKALGAGFVPLSGVLLHQKIFDAIAKGSKGLAHGHTFQAHPTAAAAALEVQKIIKKQNLLSNVQLQGHHLETLLRHEISSLPFVADIRGRGLFWAVEFMFDPVNKIPFDVKSNFSNDIVTAALGNGLNILGNLGQTGDIHVEHVIVCPAYVVTAEGIEEIVRLLKLSILEVGERWRPSHESSHEKEEASGEVVTARL